MSAKIKTAPQNDIISAVIESAKNYTPQPVGIDLFKSEAGNVVEGIYLGSKRVNREEMSDPNIPEDNRAKTITTVYIAASEQQWKRTGNPSAVQHFMMVKPGSLVRLECVQRGVKDNARSEFRLTLLLPPEEVSKVFETYDMIEGFQSIS